MYEFPTFAPDWLLYEHRDLPEQRAYLASELRRLDREGQPIIPTILALLDDWAQQLALGLVTSNADQEGVPILRPRVWMLRLVKGAKPPDRDPQGRLVSEKDRGEVLLAKVGNLGGALGAEADVREIGEWSSVGRTRRVRTGRDIYRLVRITREGTPVSLSDALAVLRQWGVGVQLREFRSRSDRPGEPGEQSNWLVEEVPPAAEAAPSAEGAAAARKRAA